MLFCRLPPASDQYIGMPPEDPLKQGNNAAASDAAAVVQGHGPSSLAAAAVIDHGKERKRRNHEDAAGVVTKARPESGDVAASGHHPTPVAQADHQTSSSPVAPVVVYHGKERKQGRKHAYEYEDAAGVGSTAARSGIDDVAAADGGATDGTRHHHHRRARASKYGHAWVRPERGFTGDVTGYSEPAPVTARPSGIVKVNAGRHRYQAVEGRYSAGGGDNSYHASDYAAATLNSSSRLVREPLASPRRHKPPKVHGAQHQTDTGSDVPARGYSRYVSSSSRLIREPAAAPHRHLPKPQPKAHAAPGEEPTDAEYRRVGVELIMMMDKEARQLIGSKVVNHWQQQPPAGAVDEKKFSYWLTDVEADANLQAVYDKMAAAASGNGKRRRH